MPRPMPRQDAHKKTRKPANRRQKAKSLRRIPLSTVTIRQINTAPVPHTAALNPVIVVVLEQPEDREPRSAEEQIDADVDERSGAVQHPDDGDPETHGGDSGAEDEAVERSDVVRVVLVQEVGTQAQHDGGADELCEAQREGDGAGDWHGEGYIEWYRC